MEHQIGNYIPFLFFHKKFSPVKTELKPCYYEENKSNYVHFEKTKQAYSLLPIQVRGFIILATVYYLA